MDEKNNLEKPEIKMVMATVILKSMTGRSFLTDNVPVVNAKPYLPLKEVLEKAKQELKKRGFGIESEGVTLSISGPLELFEKTFKVQIWQEEEPRQPGSPDKVTVYRSSQKVMRIEGLEDVIEGVVLAGRAILF